MRTGASPDLPTLEGFSSELVVVSNLERGPLAEARKTYLSEFEL